MRIFGGLIFSVILEQCGLLKRIAYWIIYLFGGSFNGAIFGVFFVGIALNIITFCNGWIVACVLVCGLCKSMNLERLQLSMATIPTIAVRMARLILSESSFWMVPARAFALSVALRRISNIAGALTTGVFFRFMNFAKNKA